MTSSTLVELEGLISDFLGSASSIKTKVTSGLSELQSVESEVSSLVETVISNAKSARDSLKAVASQVEGAVSKAPAAPTSMNDIVAAAVPTATTEEIHAAVLAFDEAPAGSDPHAAAQAAALAAGASESDAIAISEAITAPT